MTEQEKLNLIAVKFHEIMELLGVDMEIDGRLDTPMRVAKMYSRELFAGLEMSNYPRIMVQDNEFNYDQMVIESNISINSVCEHHFVPILGYAHIAYIPSSKVIGLSKLNRIAQYYARRPQVQERLTEQIAKDLADKLKTNDVAVVVDAVHCCVRMRGVKDHLSKTRTIALKGKFLQETTRSEYLTSIPKISELSL